MNENEAIQALVAELSGEEVEQETQEQSQVANETAQEAPSELTEQEQTQVASAQTPNIDINALAQAISAAMAQGKTEQPQQEQGEQSNISPEQLELLSQMGLSSIAGMQAQLNEIMAKQAQAQEQARQQQVFNQNSTAFEKEFPTIKLEELGKFAQANNAMQFLGEDYNGWRLVAKAMLNTATPKKEPDAIVGTGGGRNELSAFDRLKKGENVSDLDIGAELLKGV